MNRFATMPRCIYCLRDRNDGEFNREHVLPEAFGRFENNLTIRCVCAECNQRFGDRLERRFGRDSYEALLRFVYGVKDPGRAGELGKSRVTLTYAGEDEWKGTLLRLAEEGGKPAVDLVPQVALLNKATGEWEHFEESQLDDEGAFQGRDLDTGNVKIMAPSQDDEPRLAGKLARLGVTVTEFHDLAPPAIFRGGEGPVEVTLTIDRDVRRCAAKIALNYLAWAEDPEFVLSNDFNAIRDFVFRGVEPGCPLVVADAEPILEDDSPRLRQTNGHLITVNWARTGRDIASQVSLFNFLRYRVSLARNFRGIWRDLRSGRHFNLETGRIDELVGISQSLMPPPGFRLRLRQ